jgi:SAM-dependent methyltransferase
VKESGLESRRKNASTEALTSDWFESPLGSRVLHEEAALARLVLDDVFGFELLQVGAWGGARDLLAGARTQHTSLVAPDAGEGVTLRAPLDSLPFASDAIDAILLPHTLELVEDPYAVLREAERVLRAEGCLMIYGFNPWSGWGARRLFARYLRRPAFPPRTQRMLSERRLRDWVALLGFDVDSVYGYLGPLPLAGGSPLAGASAPEHAPRAALAAGAYLLKARKRVQTLTMLRPKRRVRQRVLVGAAESTSKVGS